MDVPRTMFLAQNMQKNDNQFQSLGICQRLLQFFMNNLIARPFKSITLRHADAEPRSSAAVPVDDSWSNGVGSVVDEQAPSILKTTVGEEKLHHQGPKSSKDTGSGSKIQVHFKQTEEELECWTSVDKLGSSVHEPIKDSRRITDGDHPRLKKGHSTPIPLSAKGLIPDDKLGMQKSKKVTEPPHNMEELPQAQVNGVAKVITQRRKARQEAESNVSTMARGRGPGKFVSIQDSKEEDRAKKGKNIISDDWTLPREREPKVVYPRHLISVASNINEKSDAFIQRQKEAMRRNLSLEGKKP
ncbi:hypothetical protein SADUNF_Sadunf08G0011500 [Salix dunnii]|uniref:Uncharacterized protein n=1 Tax=Salix dunnii TaxID=1413687 RepID=A0A835JS78_9ROSI|nr:hypothetical protein SADUNF_Sadunf08G0011500 [Salix dunnii]